MNIADKMATSFSDPFAEDEWQRTTILLQQTLQELMDSQEGTQIRLLTNQGLGSSLDAEVVIQIDEYDLRVQLLQASELEPRLTLEQLTDFQQILEANPSTVALLLTWTTDDLLTIPLTIARIRFVQQRPRVLPRLLQRARPLLAVLQNLMTRQIRQWERGLDLSQRASDEPIDIRQVFAVSLEEAFKKERKRPYRQPARKQAAHRFPVESEKAVMLAILDAALKGEAANQLIKRLML